MIEATVKSVELRKPYASYQEAFEHMAQQGVKHFGWINSGISVPDGNYTTVYRNYSGSSTLEVDLLKRISYSADMGD